MKIQILSDLHCEFYRHSTKLFDMSEDAMKQHSIRRASAGKGKSWAPSEMICESDSDVIMLSGDIDTGTDGIEWAIMESKAHEKPIIYVAGNHEYYGHDYEPLLAEMRKMAAGTAVNFLENDQVIIDGVRFLGCTFWTDYLACDEYGQVETMEYINSALNDHRKIRYGERLFLPSDALRLHQVSRRWLDETLAKPFVGPTVVVTHHGPSTVCQHKQFDLSPMSGAFWSNAENLVEKADLWVFGHTHQGEDSLVNGTRVVSNQRGYPGEGVFGFLPSFVVNIGEK